MPWAGNQSFYFGRQGVVKRTEKQLAVLKQLLAAEKKTPESWYKEIEKLVSQYDLCWDDKNDLCQTYRLVRCKYYNSPYLDSRIWTAIRKHIDDILHYRRLFSNKKIIREIPKKELYRYIDCVDYSSASDCSWDDFNFDCLNPNEYRVIELFFRYEKKLSQIAAETGTKYITVAKRFERGRAKLRENKKLFLN